MTRDRELDPVLDLYLTTFRARVAELRGFALGLYAEYRVAHLLGATPSESGIDAIDLHWELPPHSRPLHIQVKSSHRLDLKTGGSFSIAANTATGRRAGDLWIFARHVGSDHRKGWTYLIAKTALLRRFGDQRTVSANKLTELGDWVGDKELQEAAAMVAETLRRR